MKIISVNASLSNLKETAARNISISILDKTTIGIAFGKLKEGYRAPIQFGYTDNGSIFTQLIPSVIPAVLTFSAIPKLDEEEEIGEEPYPIEEIIDNLPSVFDEIAVEYMRRALDDDRINPNDVEMINKLIDRLTDTGPQLSVKEEMVMSGILNGQLNVDDANTVNKVMHRTDEFNKKKVSARMDFVKSLPQI